MRHLVIRLVDFYKRLKSLSRTRFIAEVFRIWARLWATPEHLGHSGGTEEKASRRLGAGPASDAEGRARQGLEPQGKMKICRKDQQAAKSDVGFNHLNPRQKRQVDLAHEIKKSHQLFFGSGSLRSISVELAS